MTARFEFSLQSCDYALAEEYWRRLSGAESQSFFLSWNWIGVWLRHIHDDLDPQFLTVFQDGTAVAAGILVPRRVIRHGILSAKQLHLHSTGNPEMDSIMIEQNGLIGPLARDGRLLAAMAEWFAENAIGEELVLSGIEPDSATLMARSSGMLQSQSLMNAYRAPLKQIALNGLEANLSRNARQQLRRSVRAYRAMGELYLEEAETSEDALRYFKALKELHIKSWERRGKPHAFRSPFFEQFHNDLIQTNVPKRNVQLLRISAGGTPIGYLYNFRYRETVYAYQSGFEDTDPGLRPGYISHALAIEAAARQGAHYYDFLAGTNRLKQSFGIEEYQLGWYVLSQNTLKFRAEATVRAMIAPYR